MTPARRDALDAARRSLDEAAGALDGMRRLSGIPGGPLTPASELVRREALETAREDLRRLSADLESLRAREAALVEEAARLRAELDARPTPADVEEARAAGGADASRRASELARQATALQERVSLLTAEHVRLESLRRKAEEAAAESEASRRSLEDVLRRDLRAAHAALDRAAAEAGTRDAKAIAEIEEMRRRLDQALGRLHRESQARKEAGAERGDFEAAQAVIASLRRDLAEQRSASLARERELGLRAHELERRLAESHPSPEEEAVIASLRQELADERAGAAARERALEDRAAALERKLLAAEAEAARAAAPEPAPAEPFEAAPDAAVEYPPLESSLEPGWARLFRFVRPPVQAAYAHLRRLSAGPLSAGQRAIVRLTGSSLSQAADSLATIELALSDAPATVEAAPILPVLEAALSAWEPVLRRRGVDLARAIPAGGLPDSPHDPEQLRLVLHHVLRNAVEALPRGASLRVHLRKSAADAVELEFRDDGPGYPRAWLDRRFEPFVSPRAGHAGLGLAAARRALRRWGGEASASNGANGRGARLTLSFSPAAARP